MRRTGSKRAAESCERGTDRRRDWFDPVERLEGNGALKHSPVPQRATFAPQRSGSDAGRSIVSKDPSGRGCRSLFPALSQLPHPRLLTGTELATRDLRQGNSMYRRAAQGAAEARTRWRADRFL
jgi:hypothetical protein